MREPARLTDRPGGAPVARAGAPPHRPATGGEPTYVLGISAFFHDSAACLLRDGVIVAAAQEERFSRIKGDAAFPAAAVASCLARAGIGPGDLAAVAFYDKPILKLDRILETFLAEAPRGLAAFRTAAPLWMTDRLRVDATLREELGGYDGRLLYAEHHESHAASAFYPSPYPHAAVLTVDGVGEWATASVGVGRGSDLALLLELRWPDSLGLLYSAFTYHAGFKVNSGEYKLMGLAPYGRPTYVARILDRVLDLRQDGSFTLDQRYFDYVSGLTMTSDAFSALFDGPPRAPDAEPTQREMDLAHSVQVVCEEVVMRMARTAARETGAPALCLAGGVALNAVANGRVAREGPFRDVWIQPAAGDAGAALGAALLAWHRYFEAPRDPGPLDAMHGARLGPSYGDEEVERVLRRHGAAYERLADDELIPAVADDLVDGAVVGWFDGRMEFGPRALGGRSILADPRRPDMQSRLNLKIKFREGFRPFAPSVLAEHAGDYFELDGDSPYMLIVAPVRAEHRLDSPVDPSASWLERLHAPRSTIPAVTHLDHSARVQTVTDADAPRFAALLRAFAARTGCPMLVNTSFNVRGEPIVCTPADALACFMRTDMDVLVLGSCLLRKAEQRDDVDPATWQREFVAD